MVRRGPGRPAGSNGDATRRTLLDAALAAFARRGYEGMSVRDLARELGVSHNLVHHHYGSKWALWRAALEHGCEPSAAELFALIEASRQRTDWDASVLECITGAVGLLARHPAVATIVADECARGGPRLDYLYERYLQPMATLLAEVLGDTPGHLDPRATLLFLTAGVTALLTHRALADKLGGPTAASADDVARYAATVAGLIAHGLAGHDAAAPGRPTPRAAAARGRRSRPTPSAPRTSRRRT